MADIIDYYDRLAEQRTSDYAFESRALTLVRKFVIKHKLIVFGGLAIDSALRLHGSSIYRDDEKPDIDVMSYDSVNLSYDLADELKEAGFKNVQSIRAIHLQTMRVRVDFIVVADLGFIPKSIFDVIPTINYKGMQCVHPTFQRIDMHLGLSFPYSHCPGENVFSRWSKDVKRFNMIEQYYPIKEIKQDKAQIKKVTSTIGVSDYALCGFAAYAVYTTASAAAANALTIAVDKNKICVETIESYNTIITNEDIDVTHRSFLDSLPESNQSDPKLCIYAAQGELVGIIDYEIGGRTFKVVTIQHVAVYMLVKYFTTQNDQYLLYYSECIKMIKAKNSGIFLPSLKTMSGKNEDTSYLIALAKTIRNKARSCKCELTNREKRLIRFLDSAPTEYYDKRPPPYKYDNEYFNKDGGDIIANADAAPYMNISAQELMPYIDSDN